MIPRSAPRPRAALLAGLVALLVLLAGCASTSLGESAEAAADGPTLAGYERDPAPVVGELSLPAVNRGGADMALRADPGELMLVYFGFTNCPDVCPTTLSDTRIAFRLLGSRTEDLDLAFVTVDPDRDSAEISTNYVQAFIDGGIALRTDDQDLLHETAFAFGVDYLVEENDQGEIEVGHTPNLYLVDDTGSLILTWPFGISSDDIASDLTIMLDRIADRDGAST